MSHIAIKLHFRGSAPGEGGLTRHNFVRAVVSHELASRNTALAFLAEAITYGFTRPMLEGEQTSPDGGMLPIELTGAAIGHLSDWYLLHLRALDALGSAHRVERFSANQLAGLAAMEPLVCDGLLACAELRLHPRLHIPQGKRPIFQVALIDIHVAHDVRSQGLTLEFSKQ